MSARDHALDQTVAAQHTVDELDDETSGTLLQLTPNSSKRRARSLERGAVVGRYVVLSELGSGAMGIVYAAYDPELDRKVALKLVRTTSGRRGGDEEQRTRLLREAQALAKLNHPNVVSVHDVGTLEGRVWIAMEYVHGQTLDAWGATPRPWREVLEVMRRAGEGLAAAHDAGLLHRDFKPQNVMLGHDGRVRVMDFGLARSRRGDEDDAVEDAPTRGGDDPLASRESALARDVTRAGAMMGTPAYMSPEQFRDADVTAASDQFAFAVSLWELLYGEPPFKGRTLMQLAMSVYKPPSAPARASAAPRWLRRVCTRALAPDPRDRFASMAALLDALAQGQRRVRSRRWLLALGVTGLLAAGVAGQQRYADARARAACVEEGQAVTRAWRSGAQEQVRAGILKTELSYAPATAERVLPWLDAYAGALGDARAEVCALGTVEDEWDAQTHARASWCLDERALEFDALVASLVDAGGESVQNAVDSAASLPRVDTCRDEAALRRRGPPPRDTLEEARRVRAELSRSTALDSAGAYKQGLEVAEAALQRARELDWAPLVAAALLRVGSLREEAGDSERASDELQEAYAAAVRANAPDLAAETAVQLSYTAGYGAARHELGEVWAEIGALALEQLEVPEDAPLWISLRSGMGSRLFSAGKYAEALTLFERNVVAQEAALGPNHPKTTNALHNLATLKTALGDYDEACALFERVLEQRERALGPSHPDFALSLNALAAVHLRQKSYEQARALHERAHALQVTALGEDHPSTLMTLNNLAIVHDYLGDKATATRLHGRVLAIRERALGPNHPQVAISLGNLALALHDSGEYARALELSKRALAIQKQALGEDHPDVAFSLDGMANAYIALERYDEAEDAIKRALTVRGEALGEDHDEYADTLSTLANLQLARERVDEAAQTEARALAIVERSRGADSLEAAGHRLSLAALRLRQEQHQDAAALAERTLASFETKGASPLEIASTRFLLARALERAGEQPERARALARQARDVFGDFDHAADKRAEADAWLQAHPLPSR